MVSVFKNQFFFFNLKFSINSKKAFLAIIVVPLYVQGILRALFCLISPLRASMTCNTISCACYLVHLLFSVWIGVTKWVKHTGPMFWSVCFFGKRVEIFNPLTYFWVLTHLAWSVKTWVEDGSGRNNPPARFFIY